MHSWYHWYHLWIQCLVCVLHIPPSHWAHPHPHQAHWGSWYSWTCEHLPVPRFGCVSHLHPDCLMGWDLDVHQSNPPLKTGLSLQRISNFKLGLSQSLNNRHNSRKKQKDMSFHSTWFSLGTPHGRRSWMPKVYVDSRWRLDNFIEQKTSEGWLRKSLNLKLWGLAILYSSLDTHY